MLIVSLTGRGLRRNYLELLCSNVLSSSLNLDPEWSFPLILKDFGLTGFIILWISSCSVEFYFVVNKTCWLVFLSVVLLSGFRLAVCVYRFAGCELRFLSVCSVV